MRKFERLTIISPILYYVWLLLSFEQILFVTAGPTTSQPTSQPTCQPTSQPTCQPISKPTCQPTRQPSSQPSRQPTRQPTNQPSRQPTSQPTSSPSRKCGGQPGSEFFGNNCWCSRGYYSDNGLAPCNPCDYGSSSSVIGGKLADCKCQNGFYSPTGQAPCYACPENSQSKSTVGATACTCIPGYTGYGDVIPAYMLNNLDKFDYSSLVSLHYFYASSSFSQSCVECPDYSGTWNAIGNMLSLQETSGNLCFCDPETKSSTGYGPCEPCSEGSGSITLKFSQRTSGVCSPTFRSYKMKKCYCQANYYSSDGTDQNENCQKCPTGKTSSDLSFFWSTNGFPSYSCQNCDSFNCNYDFTNIDTVLSSRSNKKCVCLRNYYQNVTLKLLGMGESSADCIECPEGTATTGLDGISCTVCNIGYYSPNGYAPCAKCADGKTTNGYQQTSCPIFTTFAPSPSPTPSPTPSSPAITNAPVAQPTRPPVQTKRPTAYPTMRPSSATQCFQGYFSINGYSPGCQACPLGSTNSGSGMTVCNICAVGYYGRDGVPPCTACPDSYMSNDRRTGCILCVGYDAGCTEKDGGSDTISNLTARLTLLEKKLKVQQSFIDRYKRQRNQVEL